MSYRETITRIKQNVMDCEEYGRIVNFRYFNNLTIIVSCEREVEELLDIDEAAGSRLIEMRTGSIVEFKGRKLNYRVYG